MRIMLRRLFLPSQLTSRIKTVRYSSKSDAASDAPQEKKVEEIIKNLNIEKYGQITIASIDRQDTRNSLDIATLKELEETLNEFENDKTANVLILHGEGGTFSSGFDLYDMEDKGYNTMTDAAARLLRRPLCDKVTIAAVSGYAVAEGFELALACDLRIIEDTAMLGCLGRRFGAPAGIFGARRLTSLIGLSRSLDLLMTGRMFTGTEAYQFGLSSKTTSTGTALGEAVKLAKSLNKFPQSALLMDKLAAVNSQLNPNSEESMRDEAVQNSLKWNAMEDMKDGVKKFDQGIGKHGKFYQLTEVQLKDWELESIEEEHRIIDPKEEAPKVQSPSKTDSKK